MKTKFQSNIFTIPYKSLRPSLCVKFLWMMKLLWRQHLKYTIEFKVTYSMSLPLIMYQQLCL